MIGFLFNKSIVKISELDYNQIDFKLTGNRHFSYALFCAHSQLLFCCAPFLSQLEPFWFRPFDFDPFGHLHAVLSHGSNGGGFIGNLKLGNVIASIKTLNY